MSNAAKRPRKRRIPNSATLNLPKPEILQKIAKGDFIDDQLPQVRERITNIFAPIFQAATSGDQRANAFIDALGDHIVRSKNARANIVKFAQRLIEKADGGNTITTSAAYSLFAKQISKAQKAGDSVGRTEVRLKKEGSRLLGEFEKTLRNLTQESKGVSPSLLLYLANQAPIVAAQNSYAPEDLALRLWKADETLQITEKQEMAKAISEMRRIDFVNETSLTVQDDEGNEVQRDVDGQADDDDANCTPPTEKLEDYLANLLKINKQVKRHDRAKRGRGVNTFGTPRQRAWQASAWYNLWKTLAQNEADTAAYLKGVLAGGQDPLPDEAWLVLQATVSREKFGGEASNAPLTKEDKGAILKAIHKEAQEEKNPLLALGLSSKQWGIEQAISFLTDEKLSSDLRAIDDLCVSLDQRAPVIFFQKTTSGLSGVEGADPKLQHADFWALSIYPELFLNSLPIERIPNPQAYQDNNAASRLVAIDTMLAAMDDDEMLDGAVVEEMIAFLLHG